ncbi:Glucan 1,3-beta-glucosidase [Drechslerella dactyloides]|uniref:Glucan 1,3-beta-glucosidase n=1 Tax=Drechslerella dactyloides TaxID=74499 RepID=A0AAD6J4G9_DREDA|nr:Glucan 1,3-beta-glucosidase [Drechslerella dactyloides]
MPKSANFREPTASLSSVFLFYVYFILFAVLATASRPYGPVVAERAAANLLTADSRVKNATTQEIESARALIKDAQEKAAVYNRNRLDHPFRTLSPRLVKRQTQSSDAAAPPRPFKVTDTIAKAAALLAEVDAAAAAAHRNGTEANHLFKRGSPSWWMGNKQHRGSWPWGDDPSFQVFRDVTDAKWATDGAARCVADGTTDCTAAINNAMKDGKRCGAGCNGSTTKQAILYFPPGTYLVSSTIEIYFGTQMIGDAVNPPTIRASSSFVGLGLFSVDHYVGDGQKGPDKGDKEWYINTANFYRQIRNFVFDLRQAGDGTPDLRIAGIHYQVGQATSLTNLRFEMTGTKQIGVYAENGSGGHISDLTFVGGGSGIWGGSQQFTAQRLTFSNVDIAVHLIWDWGWSWKGVQIFGGSVGFKLISADGTGPHNTGSIIVLDSIFRGVGTAIEVFPISADLKSGSTGITLENVLFTAVGQGIIDTAGKVYLPGGTTSIHSWIMGPSYADQMSNERTFEFGLSQEISRPDNLVTDDNPFGFSLKPFFERPKPQYEDVPWSKFISVKSVGAKGDGKTDDTAVLQEVLKNAVKGNMIVYFDAGTYLLTDTLWFPPGSRVVGEAWAQLAAEGSEFSQPDYPKPMLGIAGFGDVGSVEIQDLLFTTHGATAGVTLVSWALKADKQGSAGMWDCHVRVGGAAGTDLTSKECPPSASAPEGSCTAGNIMMHIIPGASAYLENVWLWVADHDIDDPDLTDDNNGMVQCSIFVRRGLLIESTDPVWLYGTASEHAIMYQYNFYRAQNIFATMIQTESPYYQPTPLPPDQFSSAQRGLFPGDEFYLDCPGGPGCDASWAVMISESDNIYIAGAGLYSWFSSYNQDVCVDASNCQQALIYFSDNGAGVQINNLVTIGATNMIVTEFNVVPSADNRAVDFHPFWSQITAFGSNTFDSDDDDDDLLPPSDITACGNGRPPTLKELAAFVNYTAPWCKTLYTLRALKNDYDLAMKLFNDLMRDEIEYDNHFRTYAKAFADSAQKRVEKFTNNNGNKYFTYQVGETQWCCKDCHKHACNPKECHTDSCAYCRESCPKKRDFLSLVRRADPPPKHEDPTFFTKVDEPCPPDYSKRGYGSTNPYVQTVWWSISDENRHDFLVELTKNTGISADRIKFGSYMRNGVMSSSCRDKSKDCYFDMDYGFPMVTGFSAKDVPDPKETIKKAIKRAGSLGQQLDDAIFAVEVWGYPADATQLVDAFSLPVLTIVSAASSMNKIAKVGAKMEEDQFKEIVLAVLTGTFLAIPIAGEVIGGIAGAAEIGAMAGMFAAAGNALLDLYTLVEDPENAPLAIFDLVMTPLAFIQFDKIAKASAIRRGMRSEEFSRMGKTIDDGMANVEKVAGPCARSLR